MMRVGLVFAGGFAKGAYQVGAIRALQEFVPESDICCISAASIGALNAFAYATDNVDGLEKIWRECVPPDQKMLVTKVMSGNSLRQIVSSLSRDAAGPLTKPFYCSLLDWRGKTLVYRDLMPLDARCQRRCLRGGVALPPYNTPVSVDDENISYYDGGLVDNIPVAPLVNIDLDYVICFYFDETNYQFENAYFDNRIIKISFASKSMLSHSFILSQKKIDEMIRVGYEFTKEKLSTVFANGISDLDYIYKSIEESNRNSPKPRLRLTVDVVISNLNKVTQQLTKRRGIRKKEAPAAEKQEVPAAEKKEE